MTSKLNSLTLKHKLLLKTNMNQDGDGIAETLTTTDHSLISTTEEPLHTPSPTTISKLKNLMLKLKLLPKKVMNQAGDGILETHTIMDHSPISTMEEPLHTLSLMMTSKYLNPTSKLQLLHNTNQVGDGILETLITMDHSPTSTTVELLHTPSPKTTELVPLYQKDRFYAINI